MSYYSKEIQDEIIELRFQGYSSRNIAEILGISKSGVNDFISGLLTRNTLKTTKEMPKDGPRILLLDIETSAALVYAFGRHKQYISQSAVKSEGGKVLMVGYQWLHEGETHIIVDKEEVRRGEDYDMVKAAIELVSQADAVVAHNGRNFDMKMLEARALANDLPTFPTVHILDTLEIAKKKFRLPSNKLDSLGAYLEVGRKVQHSGIDLWVRVQEGDETALLEMYDYCKQDVNLLRLVYLALRSRGLVSGFNAANYYSDNTPRCKTCGSTEIEETGRRVTTPTGIYKEIKCNDCGALHRSSTNLTTKEKRKSLLASSKT
jgi:DNA polymerase elongation subunit (family B)